MEEYNQSYPDNLAQKIIRGLEKAAASSGGLYDWAAYIYNEDNGKFEPSTTGITGDNIYRCFFYKRSIHPLTFNMMLPDGESAMREPENTTLLFEESLAAYKPEDPTVRSGNCKFVGWYRDAEYKEPFTFDNTKMPIGGLVAYAKWEMFDYTIKLYDSRGETTPLATQGVARGGYGREEESPYKVGQFVPYKGEFRGWQHDIARIPLKWSWDTAVARDYSLYATWKTGGFSVTYDVGEGSGYAPVDNNVYDINTSARVIDQGDGIIPPAETPNKQFYAWKNEATNRIYYPGDVVDIGETGNVTLVAQYASGDELVEVKYHANDGASPEEVVIHNVLKGDEDYYLAGEIFADTGKTLAGWSKTSGSDNTKDYDLGQAYADSNDEPLAVNGPLDFYAVWETAKLKVTYYEGSHGSLVGDDDRDGKIVFTDVLYGTTWEDFILGDPVPDTVPDLGYKFDSWQPVMPEGSTSIEDDLEFTATWMKEEYTVEYQWTGEPTGSHAQTIPTGKSGLFYGDRFEVDTVYSAGYEVATQDSYGNVNGKWIFSGWNPAKDFTVTDNTVITGSWTFAEVEVPKHEVTYAWIDAPTAEAGAKDVPQLPAGEQNIINGAAHVVDKTYTNGYVVNSYDTYGNLNGVWTFSGWIPTDDFAVNEDTVVKGSWNYETTTVAQWNVNYDWGKDAPSSETLPTGKTGITNGDTIAVDTTYTDKTVVYETDAFGNKTVEWKFSGWNPAKDFTVTDNTVITGSWEKTELTVPTWKVTYDKNANEATDAPVDAKEYTNGDKAKVLGQETMQRNDYVFTGWNTKADGTDRAYAKDDEITMTDNITLYAQWQSTDEIINVDKEATEEALVGSAVNYSIKVTNNGDETLQSITVTDNMLTDRDAESLVITDNTENPLAPVTAYTVTGNKITINVALGAGEHLTVKYTVSFNDEGSKDNVAEVTAKYRDQDVNGGDETTVIVKGTPDLKVTKTAAKYDPEAEIAEQDFKKDIRGLKKGDSVVYQIFVKNEGSGTGSFRFVDTLYYGDNIENDAVVLKDANGNEATGEITLKPGESRHYYSNLMTLDKDGNYTNVVILTDENAETKDPEDRITVEVEGDPNLSVKKEVKVQGSAADYSESLANQRVGTKVIYRVTVTNNGNGGGQFNIEDTYTAADGGSLTQVGADGTADSLAEADKIQNEQNIAGKGKEGDVKTYYFVATLTVEGKYTNIVAINDGNNDTEDPQDNVDIDVVKGANFRVVKEVAKYNSDKDLVGQSYKRQDGVETFKVGDRAAYCVTVENIGNAEGKVKYLDYFQNASVDLTDASGKVVSAKDPIILGAGETIKLYYLTDELPLGSYTNAVAVKGNDKDDPNPIDPSDPRNPENTEDPTDVVIIDVQGDPKVEVTKESAKYNAGLNTLKEHQFQNVLDGDNALTVGDNILFKITAKNVGQATITINQADFIDQFGMQNGEKRNIIDGFVYSESDDNGQISEKVVFPITLKIGESVEIYHLSDPLETAGTYENYAAVLIPEGSDGDTTTVVVNPKPENYTMSFEAGAADNNATGIPGNQSIKEGTIVNPYDYGIPSWSGHSFEGWRDKETGEIYNGVPFEMNGNKTYVAQWKAIEAARTVQIRHIYQDTAGNIVDQSSPEDIEVDTANPTMVVSFAGENRTGYAPHSVTITKSAVQIGEAKDVTAKYRFTDGNNTTDVTVLINIPNINGQYVFTEDMYNAALKEAADKAGIDASEYQIDKNTSTQYNSEVAEAATELTFNYTRAADGAIVDNSHDGEVVPNTTATDDSTTFTENQLNNTYQFTADGDFMIVVIYRQQPVDPIDPVDPTDPTDPVTPTDPTTPTSPVSPTDPGTPTVPPVPIIPALPIIPAAPGTGIITPTAGAGGGGTMATTDALTFSPVTQDQNENLTDEDVPLANRNLNGWSLLSLIMGMISLAMGVITLLTVFRKKAKEDEGEDEEMTPEEAEEVRTQRLYADIESEDEEADENKAKQRRSRILKVLTFITGLLPIIFFLILDNLSQPMVWINRFTPLIALLFVLNVIVLLVQILKQHKEENDDEGEKDDRENYVVQ